MIQSDCCGNVTLGSVKMQNVGRPLYQVVLGIVKGMLNVLDKLKKLPFICRTHFVGS